MSDIDKAHDVRIENADLSKAEAAGYDLEDDSRDRAIARKVDFRLLPPIAALYAFSLIDRTNMGNAVIEGMAKDLKLIGNRYNIALLLFFITYAAVEIPCTLLIRRVRPRNFIGVIGVLWGSVLIGQAFVKDWRALAATRFVLGAMEGGYFPCCVFIVSAWSLRKDTGRRMAILYAFGVGASGVSSILAYGLARIPKSTGVGSWRGIFFFQGLITVVLAIILYFFIVDFPTANRNRFLSERDHARLLYALEKERASIEVDPVTPAKVGKYMLEWKNYVFALMFMCCTVTSYALSYFLPTLLRSKLKFSLVQAQCLVTPPYIFALILAIVTGHLSDKVKSRMLFICINSSLALIGLGLIYPVHIKPAVSYFGVFLLAGATNASIPLVLALGADNTTKNSRKAVQSAMSIMGGAVGGVFGSLVFYTKSAPNYHPGLEASMACNAFLICSSAFLTFVFKRRNARQAQGEVLEGQPGFRYSF
ncbi:hypothetical protein PYCC9005_000453 [Savitreella phatthalungensis]